MVDGKIQNILVTGAGGYVGSVLVPELIEKGFHVTCLDRFFFGIDFLSQEKFSDNLTLVRDDIRWFDKQILKNIDVVMDLAALSNDPVGDLDPTKTFEINHKGRNRVAVLSKEQGVKQYILASSASIYGQQTEIVDEESAVNPITAYSKANRAAEVDNLALSDNDFIVTSLRFSSLFGLSPRMRFDTAVNAMILDLFKKSKIFVGGPHNKRPFLHVKDAVQAYLLLLRSKSEKINGEIFNVGSDAQNFEMESLAHEIQRNIEKESTIEISESPDNRSYTASFKKIKNTLGFTTNLGIDFGTKEIFNALQTGEIDDSIKTKTIEWYKKLLSSDELFSEHSLNNTIL